MRAIIRYAVPALAVACLLGACSGPDPDVPRVASFQSTPAAGPSPASSAAAEEGPLVPLDATTEERDAAWNDWNACVLANGGDKGDQRMMIKKDGHGDPKAEKIVAACRSKRPETYEERQKRTDLAAFRDNQRQWYECAKREGYKVTAADENGEFGITEVGPNGDFQSPKMENCRKAAFKD